MALVVLACALGACANPDRARIEFPPLPQPNTPSLSEDGTPTSTRPAPPGSTPVDGNDEPSQASPSNRPVPFTPDATVVY